VVPVFLLIVAAGGFWSNAAGAFTIGKIHRSNHARIEQEIRSGIPVTFVVDRHYEPRDRTFHVQCFEALRGIGVKPFRDLVADPPMTESPLPIAVARSEGFDHADGVYRVAGDEPGHLVLALPKRGHVYGLKLEYEAKAGTSGQFLNLVSWEPGAPFPPRPGYGIITQFRPTHGSPATVHIFVDRETDSLRLDLAGRGAAIRFLRLSQLTPRP
jgi:hypothetical protein